MKKEKVSKPVVETVNAEHTLEGELEFEKFEQSAVEEKKVVFDSESGIGFVEVGLSVTLKLAQRYEMARVEVKVRTPCKPGAEDETFKKTRAFVSERLRAEWRTIRDHAEKEVRTKDRR